VVICAAFDDCTLRRFTDRICCKTGTDIQHSEMPQNNQTQTNTITGIQSTNPPKRQSQNSSLTKPNQRQSTEFHLTNPSQRNQQVSSTNPTPSMIASCKLVEDE
jgi:hypothetical protein